MQVIEREHELQLNLFDTLTQLPFCEITDGFPVKNAEELWRLFYDLLNYENPDDPDAMDSVSRMPIIGMNDGRVFLRAYPNHNDHKTLLLYLEMLGYSEDTISFTTSLEEPTFDRPNFGSRLELSFDTTKSYVPIGKGSDLLGLGLRDLSVLDQLFGHIEGVKVRR